MRTMMRACVGILLVAGVSAQAERGPFTGRFLGSGRACYGTLSVRTKTLSWLTTFSQCKASRYELIERQARGQELRMTYRLRRATDACRYAVVSLTHHGSALDTGWAVTGYGSEQSYQADKASHYTAKAPDSLSCYLIRDPQP